MGTKPLKKGKEEGKNPLDPPKDPKPTPEPTVEALQEQLNTTIKALEEKTERYEESSTEGIRLAKVAKEQKAELERLKPSNEPPLEQRIPNWEDLTPEEQQGHRQKDIDRKKLREVEKVQAELNARGKFNDEFDELVVKEEFKPLAVQKAKFREYCNENLGMLIEAAAKAFLFDSAKELGATEEREKLSREGLESPTGGSKDLLPPEEGYTKEEVEHLRLTDHKKYVELIRAGKLKIKQG